jgi:hypothetical protein
MIGQKHKDAAAAASGLNKTNIHQKQGPSITDEGDGDRGEGGGSGRRSRDNEIYQDFVKKQGGAPPTTATRGKHPSSTTHSVAGVVDQHNQKLKDAAEDANDMLYKAIMQVKCGEFYYIPGHTLVSEV